MTWKSLEVYPRLLQVKKQPPLSASVFIAYIRPTYVYIQTLIQTYVYIFLRNPKWADKLQAWDYMCIYIHKKIGRGVATAAHSHHEGRSPPGRWSWKVKDRNNQFLEVIIFSLSLSRFLSFRE